MKISIGCDHGALALKDVLVVHLTKKGYEVKDFGTYTAESCDYPEFAAAAARAVASGECDKGIVLCTTGIGVSITANKIKGIRCALLSDVMSARLTREHNDTNMMALGAGVVGQLLALQIVDTWLETDFSGDERHQRRIDKLMACEE
jgi:ribose 5-phosphate isomerase B